ncbi:hypothetical protein NGM99_09025 [Mesorhizobium sp. RP14(2022)]|uniref:DUF2238 domain-containing protein n=1 Tax=Mesorhizobium liriopis TaxID=2953882 RepID=A0ABT1C547_9HYPH|nr:hypothetical protein [Mesorhizobium liriopis]MCO6049934.1 hypothetical protein [Mesorhizobium liriopis]
MSAETISAPLTSWKPAPRTDAGAPLWAWAIIGLMMLAMVFWLIRLDWRADWPAALLVLVTMFTVSFPTATRSRHPVLLPVPLELGIALFVFGALFMGEILHFYDTVWWWDLMLHGMSGVLLSAIGLLVAFGLGGRELKPRVAFLFAPMLAMSVGTVWEFFEYGIEQIFGVHMQTPISGGTGLDDTMWDLIANAVTAVLVATYGWVQTQPHREFGMPAWVRNVLDSRRRA